uniref:ditrans,polycis-polyprenyl diphosphate synthase [(2E,6E)-farnesyldiphosphate specific] n=1 Tax=Elaeophora elaphi TaxID=1147741 RepID=A0A0R3S173_9BILA
MLNVVVELLRFAYTFLEVILNYLAKPSLIVKSLLCSADSNSQSYQPPSHLAVLYTDKSAISLEALSKLTVYSARAGITKITLYDPWSYIFSKRELLRKLTHDFMLMTCPKELVDVEFYDSDHAVIHPSFTHTAVKILGVRDGRQSVVRACRKLCTECDPANITIEQISECLAKEHICEPDFLLQIGTLAGYSPWVLRITEILQLKSLPNNFSHQQFLSYLREYSSRDRRVGR